MESPSIHDLKDFQDVIRVLEEHPEWQAELRRVLLTKDFLTLPEQVSRLTESVHELVAAQTRTEQRLNTLTEQVAMLTEAQTRTEQRLNSLAEAQARTEQQLSALTTQIKDLTEQVTVLTKTTQSLVDDMGKVKGVGLETRLRLSGSPFFGVVLRKPAVLSRGEVTDLLDEAESQGQLTPTEMREVQLADLIVRGIRRDNNTPVYLVVEVSWTIDTDDVRRAAARANLLAKTGTASLPVVAGEKVGVRASELAQAMRVWQMTDDEVVPPPAN